MPETAKFFEKYSDNSAPTLLLQYEVSKNAYCGYAEMAPHYVWTRGYQKRSPVREII